MSEEEEKSDKKGIEKSREENAQGPLLNVEQPKYWMILFCILGILAVLILWSFFGRIPTEATGRSVLISKAGVFLIEAKSVGSISHLYIKEGEVLKKGEVLAKINNPKLRSLMASLEATKFKIERLRKQNLLLQQALEINIRLYKQGVIAKMIIDNSRSSVMEKSIEIEEAKSYLVNQFSELEKNSFASPEEFSHAKKLLSYSPFVIDFSEILDRLSRITAPSDGTVLEVLVNQGDMLKVSDPVFWMEYPQKDGESPIFYATIDAESQGRLRPGLKAIIEPANVNVREYGAMIGKVESIYPYPVSAEELMQTVGNKQIVNYLLDDNKAMTQITIVPKGDSKGFEWTSGKGPPYEISTGTVSKIRIIVEEQPPISYLIPLWRIKPQ